MAGLRALGILAFTGAVHATVTLPYLLSDHMVVQREQPVHIWGKANAGEAITVSFRGASRSTAADELGRWSVHLPPGAAGGPFQLKVNDISLNDVLVGDVWIASGQSNMEWPIAWAADPKQEVASAQNSQIRLVRAMHKVSEYPVDNLVGQMWQECSPQSVEKFSAVGYHFGRLLHQKLNVPIGLIQTAWGGTPIDAWTSLRAISQEPALMPVFAEWNHLMEEHAIALLRYNRSAKDWEKAAAVAKTQHKAIGPPPEKPVGPGGPWAPGGLYNAMVAPITPLAIKGVIWYQGEANGSTTRAPLYGRLLNAMIRDWRRSWGIGDFPFLIVQLANYRAPDSNWPELREGQRQALSLRNTAMVVTIDVGTPDNIHPPDKKSVGTRLALAARAVAYGEPIEYSGPMPRQVTRESNGLRVWFDHSAGLTAHGGIVRGFEVAGADRVFATAVAKIAGSTILVRSEAVPEPVHVRYGWQDSPDCNVFNDAGLPASPFRWE